MALETLTVPVWCHHCHRLVKSIEWKPKY